MDVRLKRRGEVERIDRAPARFIDDTRAVRDQPGLLGRDHIGDTGGVGIEIGRQRHGGGIDRDDASKIARADPFKMIGIMFGPGFEEERLLGELILRVENDQLRFRFGGLQIMGDQARAFIGAGRAAEGGEGHGHDDGAAILHGFELLSQKLCLRAGLPCVRHDVGREFVIAFQRIPANVDAGGEDEPVIG